MDLKPACFPIGQYISVGYGSVHNAQATVPIQTSGKQKAAVYDDAPLAHETPLILSISDIRKEYTQALARLELVAYLPSLSASGRGFLMIRLYRSY